MELGILSPAMTLEISSTSLWSSTAIFYTALVTAIDASTIGKYPFPMTVFEIQVMRKCNNPCIIFLWLLSLLQQLLDCIGETASFYGSYQGFSLDGTSHNPGELKKNPLGTS